MRVNTVVTVSLLGIWYMGLMWCTPDFSGFQSWSGRTTSISTSSVHAVILIIQTDRRFNSVLYKLWPLLLLVKLQLHGGIKMSIYFFIILQLKSQSISNINCCDAFGNTALHLAAMNGRKQVVIVLLQAGADATLRNTRSISHFLQLLLFICDLFFSFLTYFSRAVDYCK